MDWLRYWGWVIRSRASLRRSKFLGPRGLGTGSVSGSLIIGNRGWWDLLFCVPAGYWGVFAVLAPSQSVSLLSKSLELLTHT